MNRKLRMGMVGGGKDAFIGPFTALLPIWMALLNYAAVH